MACCKQRNARNVTQRNILKLLIMRILHSLEIFKLRNIHNIGKTDLFNSGLLNKSYTAHVHGPTWYSYDSHNMDKFCSKYLKW